MCDSVELHRSYIPRKLSVSLSRHFPWNLRPVRLLCRETANAQITFYTWNDAKCGLNAPCIFHCNACRQWTFSKMNPCAKVFLRVTLCSMLTPNPRKIASSVALLWPFKTPQGPLLASRGPSAPVDVFILYPPPTSRPDVRLQCCW